MTEPLDTSFTTIVTVRQVATVIFPSMATFALDGIPQSPHEQGASRATDDWHGLVYTFAGIFVFLGFCLGSYIWKTTAFGLRLRGPIDRFRLASAAVLRRMTTFRRGGGPPAAEQPIPDQPDAIPLNEIAPMPTQSSRAPNASPEDGSEGPTNPPNSLADAGSIGRSLTGRGVASGSREFRISQVSHDSALPHYSSVGGADPLEPRSPPYEQFPPVMSAIRQGSDQATQAQGSATDEAGTSHRMHSNE
ncbi:hypothetical protein F5Y03DRAFT_376815 [Xylaria venustula]|nr:hypothetical protein F5Y03DRAFT_376815 [Xylaria venustula]